MQYIFLRSLIKDNLIINIDDSDFEDVEVFGGKYRKEYFKKEIQIKDLNIWVDAKIEVVQMNIPCGGWVTEDIVVEDFDVWDCFVQIDFNDRQHDEIVQIIVNSVNS